MEAKTDTEVLIRGRVYTLSGYESEEYLQKVALYINNKYAEYTKNDSFNHQSSDTQSVLLELNIADDYLTYLNGKKSQPQLSIYKELNHCPELLLNWLSKVSLINHDVAYVLMNSIDETSSLVKTKGSRIWLPFHNYLNEIDDIQSSVFMYRISFNWQDDEALMYMRQAFYPIHKLLSKDILDYRLWYKVEPYTDHLVPWWDKCKKLRKRIIRRLKDAGYSKSVIYNYTPDSEINDWLIKEW